MRSFSIPPPSSLLASLPPSLPASLPPFLQPTRCSSRGCLSRKKENGREEEREEERKEGLRTGLTITRGQDAKGGREGGKAKGMRMAYQGMSRREGREGGKPKGTYRGWRTRGRQGGRGRCRRSSSGRSRAGPPRTPRPPHRCCRLSGGGRRERVEEKGEAHLSLLLPNATLFKRMPCPLLFVFHPSRQSNRS